MTTPSHIEALLFANGGEMRKQEVSDALRINEEELAKGAEELRQNLTGRGICIVETQTTLSLRTAPEYSELIAQIQKRNLEKEVGQAGLEVLAIVLYKGEAPRAAIDYIRGVNSSTTLRHLLIRGLLERVRNPKDTRQWIYKPTAELLAHLGLASLDTLPEQEEVASALAAFERRDFLSNSNNDQEDARDTITDAR
jgi:segregation and condensation protein B